MKLQKTAYEIVKKDRLKRRFKSGESLNSQQTNKLSFQSFLNRKC